MSTLELENIKHPDNSGNNIGLASNGNVGIGTGSPSDRLHIQKSNDTGIIIENTTGATFSLLSTGAGRVRSSGTLIFDTGGATERMRVGSNGYVGIGETSPDRYLHVKSGATNVVAKFESTDGIAAVEFTDNAGSAEVGTNAGAVVFYPSGVEKARISTQGYLTTPNQPSFYVKDLNYSTTGGSYGTGGFVHNNNGNHYNTSNGRFTAPVSGTYAFYGSIQQFQSGATDYVGLAFDKNGVQYGIEFVSGIVTNNGHYNDHHTQEGFIVIIMNSGDYINIEANRGARNGIQNVFGGYLIG